MASTIESAQLFGAHENHTTTFSRPEPIRTTSIPRGSSIGQSPWTGLNNIWTKPGGYQGDRQDIGTRTAPYEKSENMVESELTLRPVSPNHHDRLSRLRGPTANGACALREQRSLVVTTTPSRHLSLLPPPSTSSTIRALAPHVSPPRARQQGLPVLTAGQPMSILSNAGLLSGSAPDFEAPSTNPAYPHHLSGQNAFRTLNIEGVNEFVPLIQRNPAEPRVFENGFAYGHVPQTHLVETARTRNPVYLNDQNLASAKYHDPRTLDQSQCRFGGNVGYAPGISRGTGDINNRAPNSFGDEYDFESRRTINVPTGNFPAPELSGEHGEFGMGQRHGDARGRPGIMFESDPNYDFKLFGPAWNNNVSNSQTYEHQCYAHINRNAFFANKETPSGMNHDIRNGMYTPAFTPPSAPESQRSASGSGPSTGISNQAIDFKTRAYENNQPRAHGRAGTNPGYASQSSHGYSHGYQQTGGYSDAYAANRMVNAMGPTSQEIFEQREDPEKPISPFLKEFKASCKTKRYELKDVYGYIVEFSGDQHGSRFIQGKLETANSDEKEQVFAEVQENALQLMTDIFGNYVIQKLFEHGTQAQKKVLANQMKGRVLYLTTQVYGCRVVQKALEHILTDQQASTVRELEGHILPIVENQNGNHVIQKAIERVPGEHIHFIIDALKGQIVRLAKHNYGCRVVQRMLEYSHTSVKRSILAELHTSVSSLIADTFGNYVVQHIIRHGEPADRTRVVALVQQQLLFYSKHKFASNVVEAAIESSEENQRQEILRGLTGPDHEGHTPVYNLIRDQYGNYVIQKVLQRLTGPAKDDLIRELRHSLIALRRVSNGKQVSAIEKAIAEATSGCSQPSALRTSHHGAHATQHISPADYYHIRTQYHGPPAAYPRTSTNGVRS